MCVNNLDVTFFSCRSVWDDMKSLETTDDLTYHWNKSKWNTQLFNTLHIDTRNIVRNVHAFYCF